MKHCDNCIDGRRINTPEIKAEFPNQTLCVNPSRSARVRVTKRFCGSKAYVRTRSYDCFKSGGFD